MRIPITFLFSTLLVAQTGPYLGQKSPGLMPTLFAPGVVSTGLYERDLTVTSDGTELYFTVMGGYSVILRCVQVKGRWEGPEVVPFSGGPVVMDAEPALSPDGKRLYFLSTRPKDGSAPKAGWVNQDLWVVDRTPQGWSEPRNLGEPVNTDAEEFYPSITHDGTIYFTRGREKEKVSEVWRARWDGARFTKAERLPDIINGGGPVFNACISPDERMLVFCAAGRKGSLGPTDHWISFRSAEDAWSEPKNLGEPFNGPGLQAISPSFSSDGKYFFFASNRRMGVQQGPRTYASLQKERVHAGNGNADLWWVEAKKLEEFR
ncbi:MAG: hypothetical protein Q8O00_01155 [Holophaga sp.]|nr:hypothetical protein [Holophaga sp.]